MNRDAKGRFVKGNDWRFKPYPKKPFNEVEAIREAFIAGLNSHGGIAQRPSVLADRYLRTKGRL